MNCTNCGAELASGAKFCTACGQPVAAEPVAEQIPVQPVDEAVAVETPVEQVVEAPAAESKIDVKAIKDQVFATVGSVAQKLKPVFTNKKVLTGIGGVLAVILIIGIIVAIANSGNGFIQTKQYTWAVFNGDDISVIVDNKVLSDTISSDFSADACVNSLNGKVTAILTDEGDLHVVNGKKIVKVDEDVASFQLSPSGKGLAYAVDEDDAYTLKLYTVSSKKTVTVSDEMCSLNFAISPDGKSVVYGVEDDDEVEIMYAKGDKSQKVASDVEDIVGLSNNGKYIYLISENDDGDSILYSYNKKGERENLGDVDSDNFRFNDDHTQVMFYNDDKTYISNKGKDGEKIVNDTVRLVVAPNAHANSYSSDYATTYPVSSLYNHVYTGDNAWLIKKNADKTVKLASDVSNCTLDQSAEFLYFIHDGEELMVLEISKGDKAYSKAVTLAEDIGRYTTYVVTSNRKLVYFIDDETLYSVNGKKGGKAKKISNDDVEGSLAINSKDVVFYVMDGDAYACSNGKKGKKILSDVIYAYNTPTGIAYALSEDTLYANKTGNKLKEILTIDD